MNFFCVELHTLYIGHESALTSRTAKRLTDAHILGLIQAIHLEFNVVRSQVVQCDIGFSVSTPRVERMMQQCGIAPQPKGGQSGMEIWFTTAVKPTKPGEARLPSVQQITVGNSARNFLFPGWQLWFR